MTETSTPGRRSTITNSIAMLTGQVIGKGMLFASLMLLSRYLDDASFGMITFGISISIILFFVVDMGVSPIANRKFSIDPSRIQEVFSTALGLRAIMTFLGYSILTGISFLVYSTAQATVIALIGAGFVLDSWGELVFAIFRSRERMGYEAFVRIAGAVTSLVCVLLVIKFELEIYAAAGVYTVRAFVLLCAALVFLRKFHIRPVPGFSKSNLLRLFRESWPLGAMGLLFVALQRSDCVILETVRGVRAIGAYNEIYKILETMILIITPTLLPGALFPSLCRAYSEGWSHFSNRMAELAQLVTGLAGLVMIPFLSCGTRILELIWGADYLRGQNPEEMQLCFTVLMAAIPVLFWMNYMVASVIASGRQRITIAVTGIALFLSISGNMLLIPAFGLVGIAVMVAAANGIMVLLYVVLLRQQGSLPLFRHVLKPLASAIAAAIMAYVLRDTNLFAVRFFAPMSVYLAVWIPTGGLRPLMRRAA